jgi:hypothetical protein
MRTPGKSESRLSSWRHQGYQVPTNGCSADRGNRFRRRPTNRLNGASRHRRAQGRVGPKISGDPLRWRILIWREGDSGLPEFVSSVSHLHQVWGLQPPMPSSALPPLLSVPHTVHQSRGNSACGTRTQGRKSRAANGQKGEPRRARF